MIILTQDQAFAIAILAVGTLILTFVIAWDMSVHKFREHQLHMADDYDKMGTKYIELSEALEKDPVRMGLNTGQEYILRELSLFIDAHEKRLEDYK